MLDVDTFLTYLYVMADEFCQTQLPPDTRPGPPAARSRSEVVTLALFGQWARFASERSCYRYATKHLRAAFPTLPDRAQFNRLLRVHHDAIVAFGLHIGRQSATGRGVYEVLDTLGVPTRNSKRRGRGWLVGQADRGWSNRVGWYEGVCLLLAVTPQGVITGFGFGPASAKEQPLAESFCTARQYPTPRLPSAGPPAPGPYVADRGFEGTAKPDRWPACAQAGIISPPKRNRRQPWPKRLRRWLARQRQIIETVNDKLLYTFRLDHERPHTLRGFQARLAAVVGLHNFCIWLNEHLGRPRLAFAALLDW